MRMLQFPKQRWTGGLYPTMDAQGKLDKLILEHNELDEFEKEIQLTRQNEPLMSMLEKRAKAIASVSLEEIKKRMAAT